MIRGLVFGKFYPFHQGHESLIRFASSRCDELIVLVCAEEREKIPLELRKRWVRESCARYSHIEVRGLAYDERELPNSSVSSRSISKVWSELFLRILPRIDVVFTGEEYGDFVAEYMGIRHERVYAPGRISATMIRNAPQQYWEHIAPPARHDMVQKVVLLGTESTGKSTLAHYLSERYQAELVSEVGRDVVPHTNECRWEDLERIGEAHAAAIEEKMQVARRLLVIDTNVLITQSYARYLFRRELCFSERVLKASRADLYLYLASDAPYVQDGTRLSHQLRDELDASHRQVIAEAGIVTHELRGSWETKYRLASELVEALLPFQGVALDGRRLASTTRSLQVA